jgi:hypothetical protein
MKELQISIIKPIERVGGPGRAVAGYVDKDPGMLVVNLSGRFTFNEVKKLRELVLSFELTNEPEPPESATCGSCGGENGEHTAGDCPG